MCIRDSSYATKPSTIPWAALALQFGSEYGRTRDFKAAFLDELRKVTTVYQGANVDPLEAGLLVKPARPHVARRVTR